MPSDFPIRFTQTQRQFFAISIAYGLTTTILFSSVFRALDVELLVQSSGMIGTALSLTFIEQIKSNAPVEEIVFRKYALKIKLQMAAICTLLLLNILLLKSHNYLVATFWLSLSFFIYSLVLWVVESPNWKFSQNLRMLDFLSSVFPILMMIGVSSGETSLLSFILIVPALALGWLGTTLSVYLQGKVLKDSASTADGIHSDAKIFRLNWLGIKTHLCFAVTAACLAYASLFRREIDDLLLAAIITFFSYLLCLRHISHMRREISDPPT